MDKLKSYTFNVILFTTIMIILDKFTYDGWKWIAEHQTCTINGMQQICWGTSPFPTYGFTLIVLGITYFVLKYDYNYIKWYLYERNNEET